MANPNIVQVTSILGNNFLGNLESTGTLLVVNNAASSGKIYKLNNLTLSNYNNSTNIYSATVNIFENDDLGGNAVSIVTSVDIPGKASISIIDKATSIYLKEDQSIGVTANVAGVVSVVASWEEISQ